MRQLTEDIIENVAERMQLPKSVVETVVMEQFRNVAKRMSVDTSIELSGFGVFHFLPKKAERMLQLLKQIEKEQKPLNIDRSMEDIKQDILLIENQLNKCLGSNK